MDKTIQPLWVKYTALTNRVRQDHLVHRQWTHHSFLHALVAAQYAQLVAEHDLRNGELAWIAGIIHNTDRIIPNILGNQTAIRNQLVEYLELVPMLDEDEHELAIFAVLNHNRRYQDQDHPVLRHLMDGDKLANMLPDRAWRVAEHFRGLPGFDPDHLHERHPQAGYGTAERHRTHHDDTFWSCWEWVNQGYFRTTLGQQMAERLLAEMHVYFVTSLAERIKQIGLDPYPFAEDFDRFHEMLFLKSS